MNTKNSKRIYLSNFARERRKRAQEELPYLAF